MEKIISVTYSMARDNKINNLTNFNEAIRNELRAGRSVYATVPSGTFKGSIGRLKIGKKSISELGHVFKEEDRWGTKLNKGLKWDLEFDGSNRTISINWHSVFLHDFRNKNQIDIYLGRTAGTSLVRVEKLDVGNTLLDFMGQVINEGDYVLMYNGPRELKDTGSPFRMLRYTGQRSAKQAMFKYVSLIEGKQNPDGGETIRVGMNSRPNADVADAIFGVKVEVDSALETAMQMVDYNVNNFPIKFKVGLE